MLHLNSFRLIERESGEVNYYSRAKTGEPHIRGSYRPPWESAVLGYEVPEKQRRSIGAIEWSWRAIKLPRDANECVEGKGDSAASVYVTWKRGLKWYSIKYVWTTNGVQGTTCRKKRGPFSSQDTVVVERGGPLNEWRVHRIVPDVEFRKHFADGDPNAEVPALVGLGLMTDGDQTRSESVGDYSRFVITPK